MSDRFLTIAGPVVHETDRVKGSRFIALLTPVASDEEIDRALADARTRHPRASHHCLAARLGHDPVMSRSADDGEPGGSAGRPMINQLEGREVTDVVAVVVRYFGGTKLGVGGLVRAYGGAVAEALDRAALIEIVLTQTVVVVFDYELSRTMRALLHERDVTPSEETYEERVTYRFDIPRADVTAFVAEVTDRTAGRAQVRVTDDSTPR